MKKSEANISIVLRHYLKANPLPYSCPIEVKSTRGKAYFPLSELKEEQINNALASKSKKGNLIRIASGTVGAPDYVWMYNAPSAFIFIHYPGYLIGIDIDTLVKEKTKSLTLERAQSIADKVIPLSTA